MLVHAKSNELYPITFTYLQPKDMKEQMQKRTGWTRGFNWKIYFGKANVEVFKLMVSGSDWIEGVVAIEIKDGFVEILLAESAPHNRGAEREFYEVGSHLFAIACQRSIDLGFEGYVTLTAKSNLIDYYSKHLGAVLIHPRKRTMMIDSVEASRLVRVYLK